MRTIQIVRRKDGFDLWSFAENAIENRYVNWCDDAEGILANLRIELRREIEYEDYKNWQRS